MDNDDLDIQIEPNLRPEGLIEDTTVFDLDLDDKELLRMLKGPISESETFWNSRKGFNLDEVRQNNKNLWLGKHLTGQWNKDVYDYSVPYVDNRIFMALETIVSTVGARSPVPEAYPAQNSLTSKKLAIELEAALAAYTDDQQVIKKARVALKHLLLFRIGGFKVRWDPNIGRKGEIITEYFMPGDVIVDKDAIMNGNPRFIAHYMKNTVDELLVKFPDAKDKLFAALNIKQGRVTQTQQVTGYKEVWFTYYKDDKPQEGLAWFYNDVVLGKMRNPNWNYTDNAKAARNFLDNPLKPFFPINYLNLGDSYIDHTTATEQAEKLQRVLNKRGRQIIENADKANSGLVVSSRAMTKDDAANITGAPDEVIVVDTKPGEPVGNVMVRYPIALLPNYVIQDKFDARNEIDNIFGTPPVFRGEDSKSNTLGQDVLVQRQAAGRQEEIVRCLDDMFERYYRYLVQMMVVYYTEDHWFRMRGEDGKFDFIVMRADKIEDGVDVRIKAGSTLPVDKAAMRMTAIELAKLDKIDPISLYEDLGMPNARKRFERLMKWKTDPMALAKDVADDDYDMEAFMDITIINANQKPKVRTDISDEYLGFYREYMMSGDFTALKPEIQQKHQDWLTICVEIARRKLMLMETQMPGEQDQMAANEAAVQQAQQAGQIMTAEGGAQGQPPGKNPAQGAAQAAAGAKTSGAPPGTPAQASQSPVV